MSLLSKEPIEHEKSLGQYQIINTDFLTQLNDNIYIIKLIDHGYYTDDGLLWNELSMSGWSDDKIKKLINRVADRFGLVVHGEELRIDCQKPASSARLLQGLIFGFAVLETSD